MEAGVVHVLKAMARHAGAAQSLLEDDALQLLFHMVATGVPAQKKGISDALDLQISTPLHLAQLRRHAMQVRSLLEAIFLYCCNVHYLRL